MKTRLRPLKQLDGRRISLMGPKGTRPIFNLIGDPSNGKPTILINCGWASVPELYYSIAEGFSKRGFAVVIMSMRGVGGNPIQDSTSGSYIQDNAEDSLFVLKNQEVKEVILVPHSCGAQVALRLIRLLEDSEIKKGSDMKLSELPKDPGIKEDSEIKLRGVIFNAPSVPDIFSAFPNQTILQKITRRAAAILLSFVSLTNENSDPNLFSRVVARFTVTLFRILNPILIRKSSKESKAMFREFWKEVSKLSNFTLVTSLNAIKRNGEINESMLFTLDVPSLIVGYEHDSLVSSRIGKWMVPYFGNRTNNMWTALINGESHFGHEANPSEFFEYVDSFIGFTKIDQPLPPSLSPEEKKARLNEVMAFIGGPTTRVETSRTVPDKQENEGEKGI